VTTGPGALPPIDDPLELTRAALAGRRAWLVGGAVRDRLLGRRTGDLDVVLDGEPREAARALARAARAAAFALSEEYGGWRVVARDGAWQVYFERLRGSTLEEDLALRDFTVNAIAEPLGEPGAAPGEAIDPLHGIEDLARGRLREAGPRAFAEDPLRVLRLVRLAVELDLEPDPDTRAHAHAHAAALGEAAPERIFMELCRILDAPRAVAGMGLMGEVGATAVVLPELEALHGVTQSHHHHRDVYGHTLEVLEQVIALQEDPVAILSPGGWGETGASGVERAEPARDEIGSEGSAGGGVRAIEALPALLAAPLADGLTRGGALRWGALLAETGMRAEGECLPASVDAAKPLTRDVRSSDGGVTFIGHDARGAQLAAEVLGRLRASGRLRAHVAALVRNHLRLGFLVHEPQPLARRTVFAYLRACEPVEVDVTLLSVADRLAGRNGDAGASPGCGRGERAQEAIDSHLRLARRMLADAIGWRAEGPPRALLRGDELASELGIPAGPRLGELLEELLQAQYAGEIATREDALAYARAHAG
jgi:poly(A) polymerase